MENLINSLSGTQIAIQPQLADISQEQLTVAQQMYIDYIDKGRVTNSPETSTVTIKMLNQWIAGQTSQSGFQYPFGRE